MDKEMY